MRSSFWCIAAFAVLSSEAVSVRALELVEPASLAKENETGNHTTNTYYGGSMSSGLDRVVISSSLRPSQAARRALLQDPLERSDICDNGSNVDDRPPSYGKCAKRRFPDCNQKEELCYFRMPRDDKFINGNRKNPEYFIDYRRVVCIPSRGYNCNRCDPGKFCESLGVCLYNWNKYCPESRKYDSQAADEDDSKNNRKKQRQEDKQQEEEARNKQQRQEEDDQQEEEEARRKEDEQQRNQLKQKQKQNQEEEDNKRKQEKEEEKKREKEQKQKQQQQDEYKQNDEVIVLVAAKQNSGN
jgi:hypothetical protein